MQRGQVMPPRPAETPEVRIAVRGEEPLTVAAVGERREMDVAGRRLHRGHVVKARAVRVEAAQAGRTSSSTRRRS